MAVIDRAAKGAPDAPEVTAPPFDFRRHLEPFERLHWQGRPDPAGGSTPIWRLFLALFVLFCGWLIFSPSGDAAGEDPGLLFGAVVVAVGAVFGYFITERNNRRLRQRICYAVTDRQVLRADSHSGKVLGRPLVEIRAVEVSGEGHRGTIRFRVSGDEAAVSADGRYAVRLASPLPAFIDVEDAPGVAALVERLKAKAQKGPPASPGSRVGVWRVVRPPPGD